MRLVKESTTLEIDVTPHAVTLLRRLADDIESGVAKVKSAHRISDPQKLPEQYFVVVFDKDPVADL